MVTSAVNSSFLTAEQFKEQQIQSTTEEDMLGRDAFLKLLTTQLTNQSPLDPMDNEAFVAQLAQFSSVEGIKGMQQSLEQMVTGMRQDQMLTGANLVGKSVALDGGRFYGGNGQFSEASVSLDNGAQSLILSVHDRNTGELVNRSTHGPQPAGQMLVGWDGLDQDGNVAPQAEYVMSASVVRSGKLEAMPVTTMNRVSGVRWDPDGQQLYLDIGSGDYVSMAEVKQIGG
jgi:flagellar basal-body rod modification protein FlgD